MPITIRIPWMKPVAKMPMPFLNPKMTITTTIKIVNQPIMLPTDFNLSMLPYRQRGQDDETLKIEEVARIWRRRGM